MLKFYPHLTTAFLIFLAFSQRTYATNSKSFGTLEASVVDVSSISSSNQNGIYLIPKQSLIKSDGNNQSGWFFFDGSIIYKIESEPNSVLNLAYEPYFDWASLDKKKELYNDKYFGADKDKSGKINISMLNFNKNGVADLKLKPELTIADGAKNKNYRVVYYITILY